MSLPRTLAGACCLLAAASACGGGTEYGPPQLETEAVSAVNGYVSYYPGTLPIILSAPHGGTLRPETIADRREGNILNDAKTEELARFIAVALTKDGQAPHLVVNHLHRSKLDANRPLEAASASDPVAEDAWQAYHGFIEQAGAEVAAQHGRGLLLDVHGHAHDTQWVELGYLITGAELSLDDDAVDALASESSVAGLTADGGPRLSSLLRGPDSLGARLAQAGYRSVPSPDDPAPAGKPYYSGGYTVARHGSVDGGSIDAIQLEVNREGIRDTRVGRLAFAAVVAEALRSWTSRFHGP